MKIVKVEYRRLYSLGNFENETIGVVAEVQEDGDGNTEDAEAILAHAKEWCDDRFAALREMRGDQRLVDDLRHDVEEKKFELANLEVGIEKAKARWEKAMAFLKLHGLSTDFADDMPF
jgi:hypothetical protein